MVDVDHALARILALVLPLPAEEAPLLEARGRVAAAPVIANDNVPPFRNSAMDGFAVRSVDVAGASATAPVALPVQGEVAAGDPGGEPLAAGSALRIMTGAPVPAGADAVVRFEETDEAGHNARQLAGSVQIFRAAAAGENVREAGEDIAAGAVIVNEGQRVTPPLLGALASAGVAAIPVHRRPVVAILSTGNEVVGPGGALAPGKIRDSNAAMLAAMAESWGAQVQLLGVASDTVEDVTAQLRAACDADLIVSSGGVSLGDFDLVKDVLQAAGEMNIWQVRMKPGKPLAAGVIGGTPLLGLPGNPVAAGVSFLLFGRPAILKLQGRSDLEPAVVECETTEPIDNRGGRRHYLRVTLERCGGRTQARPAGRQGAGVLSSLAAADALLVIPEQMEQAPAGTRLHAIKLDW
ncbi:MAG: molybdopterin molybdotransferase MoeA [Thermomicrobiales bacterium]